MLSSFPFDMLTIVVIEEGQVDTSMLKIFSLLKLIRVLRLSRIISYMNIKDGAKMSIKLLKLIFFLVLYLHCQGCLWFIIVNENQKWVPPLDYVYMETELYKDSILLQYLLSLYHSIILLAGGDIGPSGNIQLCFCIFALLIWAFINATIFGNLAVLISSLNRKAAKFQDKLDRISTAMKNMRLPETIQQKVQDYITSTQSTFDQQKELDNFLDMISPTLRIEVIRHVFLMGINQNPVFENEWIDYILRYLEPEMHWPEDIIINQGDPSDWMYFLAKGEVEILVLDEFNIERYIRTLKTGAYFGEVGVIKSCARTATAKSQNYTTIAQFHKFYFKEFKIKHPKVVTIDKKLY